MFVFFANYLQRYQEYVSGVMLLEYVITVIDFICNKVMNEYCSNFEKWIIKIIISTLNNHLFVQYFLALYVLICEIHILVLTILDL